MARTTISSKYQVVIPKAIRERHGLKAGQQMQVVSKGNVIALVPDRPVKAYRGILGSIENDDVRDKTERS